jgi:uncharacterized membrane protein
MNDYMPHEYAWYMLVMYTKYYTPEVLVYALVYILPITLTLYGVRQWLKRRYHNTY